MKYKVGDRVKIKSLDWYNETKNQLGRVNCGSKSYTIEMCFFAGKILTIQAIGLDFYLMEEDNLGYEFTDKMIEGLAEEEVGLVDNFSSRWVNEFNLPDGYIFKDENGNVINATKIVMEKKKKEYPKTYEECLKVLNIEGGRLCFNNSGITQYERDLYIMMNNLSKLLICRAAYWKIAGEEMGLGKPWEPDYDSGVNKYGIIYMNGVVQKSNPATNWERHLNKVLDFPTEEMRDAFKKNFDTDIEICKELL